MNRAEYDMMRPFGVPQPTTESGQLLLESSVDERYCEMKSQPYQHFYVVKEGDSGWKHTDLLQARMHARRLSKLRGGSWEDYFLGAVFSTDKLFTEFPDLQLVDFEPPA